MNTKLSRDFCTEFLKPFKNLFTRDSPESCPGRAFSANLMQSSAKVRPIGLSNLSLTRVRRVLPAGSFVFSKDVFLLTCTISRASLEIREGIKLRVSQVVRDLAADNC